MSSSLNSNNLAEIFSTRLIKHEMDSCNPRLSFRKRQSSVVSFLVLFDAALILVSYIAALILVGATGLSGFSVWVLAIISIPFIASTAIVGGYKRRVTIESARFISENVLGWMAAVTVSIVAIFFVFEKAYMTSRMPVVATLVAAPALSIVLRYFRIRFIRRHSRKKSVVIIGDGPARDRITNWMRIKKANFNTYYAASKTALIDDATEESGKNMTGATIEEAVVRLGEELEAVIIADKPENLSPRLLNRLVAINFNTLPVYTLEAFYAREWQVVPLSTLSSQWALNEGFALSQNENYTRLKRMYDVTISGMALLLLSPLLGLIALAVKIDSHGPAIFKQTRVGLNERKFTLYKFRSMTVGSEKGPTYTAEKDVRITRIGGFLRKSRIDELPQLFNVLRGDMSLIGPRAEWDKLVDDYERLIPYYHFRHLVKPGITGWAQINYQYGASLEDTQVKLRYDLFYVRYYSFTLDLSIMFDTVYVMLFGKGR
jgi:exopolysaccharide biosynthesis polyprenyl glycosylphosphotransferase